MIYTDMEVDIPQKKQINKRGDKKFVYEILKRKKHTTKDNDPNDKDIVKVVGVVVPDKPDKMYPNDNYFQLHPEALPIGREEPGEFDDVLHVGADFIVDKLASELNLWSMLQEVFPDDFITIRSLIHFYLIGTNSAAQLYKYFAYNHYTGLNHIPSEASISVLFNHGITEKEIHTFLELWLSSRVDAMKPGAKVAVDYDSTSFNTAASRASYPEFGHPKEDEGLPQYNVAYFVDQNTGIPFYYDLYYGSIVDMTHCRKAYEKLESFKKEIDVTCVMDRGYFTRRNLRFFLSQSKFHFICMGKNNAQSDELIKEYGNELRQNAKYWIAEYDTSGIRIDNSSAFKKMEDMPQQYIYLFYNKEKALQEEAAYNIRLKASLKACREAIDRDVYDTNGIYEKTYGKYVHLEIDEKDRKIIAAWPNSEEQTKVWANLGFFWTVSADKMTPEENLSYYKNRDDIEKCFRDVKSFIGFKKIYAQTDSCIESKQFVAFLCSMIKASLLGKARSYFEEKRSETVQTLLCEADKIKIIKQNDKFIYKYCLTKTQRKILKCFGINDSTLKSYLQSINTNNACVSKID